MNSLKTTSLIALLLFSFTAVHANAEEQTTAFKKKHPRRAEVNSRIRKERREIKKDVKSGAMTKDQGSEDLKALRDTKQKEISEVKANGGHLTKDQQNNLNQNLNDQQKKINEQVGAGKPIQTPAMPTVPAVPSIPGTSH